MTTMTLHLKPLIVLAMLLPATPLAAQIIAPPGAVTLAPVTAPPPPRIEVPVVPKLDDVARAPTTPLPRNSFSDRITDCMHDGAAAGLRPGRRAAYARACANR